jgi:alanyl-tRNA synthetase
VFMQYNRSEEGTLSPLPKPSIDTGMGLERITSVKQGARSNYETDLFWPIIHFIEEISGQKYQAESFAAKSNVSIRVIADHARACTFLIGDGVHPANEGRGYVLRRIIRRAARHGKLLGIDRPFLYQIIDRVVEVMQETYPEIPDYQVYIASMVRREEERFIHTLERGTAVLDEVMERTTSQGSHMVPGEEIFKLYDTFGFPVDITQDILKENNLAFDEAGFQAAMERQRTMARQSWQIMEAAGGRLEASPIVQQLAQSFPPTRFLGYSSDESSATVLAIIRDGQRIAKAAQGEEVDIILDQTPFYGEKGGQVGDQGVLEKEGMRAAVLSTQWPVPQLTVHRCRIRKGDVAEGNVIQARVDRGLRLDIARNHTATHLLQAALRQVLGDHVKQSGSLVAPDRLRFDFTHFTSVLPEELQKVELLVYEKILEDVPVVTEVMKLEEAVKSATALFGEKYDQQVRVVRVDDFSAELCGGTHTKSTGEIGLFKIISESSIAAGIRRIEAITGIRAHQYIHQLEHEITRTARLLKSDLAVSQKVEQLLASLRQKEKEADQLKEKLAAHISSDILKHRREVSGVPVLVHHLEEIDLDPAGLRTMADLLRDRLRSGIIALGNAQDGKVNLVVVVTNDLTDRFHAGKIIKEISAVVGGSGGGRPSMAQAGGNKPEKLNEALSGVLEIVRK